MRSRKLVGFVWVLALLVAPLDSPSRYLTTIPCKTG
jgi:hypothetical protein